MSQAADPYGCLRPPEPTPADEICTCGSAPAIKLMTRVGFNPIHCVACNLEVPPERLHLSSELARAAAHWNWIASAIDCLELDSGAYEGWARVQFATLASPVNVEGRAVAAALDRVRRCYYWRHHPSDATSGPTTCPSCGQPWARVPVRFGSGECACCESCRLLTEASDS